MARLPHVSGTVVPVHANRPLAIGTLRKILRDIDLTPDEFIDRWHAQS